MARGDSSAVQARRARAQAASAAISAPIRPSAAAPVAAALPALPPTASSADPPRVLCLSDLHADAPLAVRQRARQPHSATCNRQPPAGAQGSASISPPLPPPSAPVRTHMDLLRRISRTRFQRDMLLVAGASPACCRMGCCGHWAPIGRALLSHTQEGSRTAPKCWFSTGTWSGCEAFAVCCHFGFAQA